MAFLFEVTNLSGLAKILDDQGLKPIFSFWNRPLVSEDSIKVWFETVQSASRQFGEDVEEAVKGSIDWKIFHYTAHDQRMFIHAVAVWEFCEHLGIKYPKEAVDLFLRESSENTKKSRQFFHYNSAVERQNEQNLLKLLTSSGHCGLKKLQVRALWNISIIESQLLEEIKLDDERKRNEFLDQRSRQFRDAMREYSLED